jgi:hypothetical protein
MSYTGLWIWRVVGAKVISLRTRNGFVLHGSLPLYLMRGHWLRGI